MEPTPESIQPADHQDRPKTRLLAAVTSEPPVQPRTQAEKMRELRLNAAVDLLLAYLLDDTQAVLVTTAKGGNTTPERPTNKT